MEKFFFEMNNLTFAFLFCCYETTAWDQIVWLYATLKTLCTALFIYLSFIISLLVNNGMFKNSLKS